MFGSSSNTFDPAKDIPSLVGKTYILTGGNAGIGLGIASHLLEHDCAKLYLIGKKQEHLDSAIEHLKQYGDTSRVVPVQCEFEDLKDTDRVAKELVRELGEKKLNGLILNAGLGVGDYRESVDGLEVHMQVKHLNPIPR